MNQPHLCWALRDALLGSEGGITLVYPLCSTLLQELFLHAFFLLPIKLQFPIKEEHPGYERKVKHLH